MLTIRPAVPDDLAHIMAIVERAVDEMNRRGNPQWGPGYPSLAHYAGALAEGSLYVAEDGALLGCASIRRRSPLTPLSPGRFLARPWSFTKWWWTQTHSAGA